MAKLTKSQERKALKLTNLLRKFEFTDVQVHFNSRLIVSGKRDFLTSSIVSFFSKNWYFYYDGVQLDIYVY